MDVCSFYIHKFYFGGASADLAFLTKNDNPPDKAREPNWSKKPILSNLPWAM